MSQTINVLSIDGGGIRGLVPGLLLAEIEARTGKRIWELFDLIAGTSTGGILALGLTVPAKDGAGARYTALDAVRLYSEKGDTIFSRDLFQRLRTADGLLSEKYPYKPIEEVLESYFGEARLKDAMTNVLVTSYEIEQRFAFLFKSWKARNDPSRDFPMRQVARATSAAPTYFEPLKLDAAPPNDYYTLVDGGVYANNPAMCAYVEARCAADSVGDTDVLVVSLGTGELTRRLAYEKAKDWGLAQWAHPILNVVFHGVSSTIDYQLKTLLAQTRDGKPRYYRFEDRLDEANDDMDDASPENMHLLKQLSAKIIDEHAEELDQLCAQLTTTPRVTVENAFAAPTAPPPVPR
jgi:predicted acylesterase/phospholipase RssA